MLWVCQKNAAALRIIPGCHYIMPSIETAPQAEDWRPPLVYQMRYFADVGI
jgi:hypothetical protein